MKNNPLQILCAKEQIISLADFCLIYPCNTYLHLAHGLFLGLLDTYKLSFSITSKTDESVEIHHIPAKYLPHEDICRDFNILVFKQADMNKLKRYQNRFSKFNFADFREYDFCTPYNIEKVAPQLAYIIQEYSRKNQTTDFTADEAREIFYSTTDKYYSRWEGERIEWNISLKKLWPKNKPYTTYFSPDYLESHAKKLVDRLKPSGLEAACRPAFEKEYARAKTHRHPSCRNEIAAKVELLLTAKIIDSFFPVFQKGGLSAARRTNIILKPNEFISHEGKRKRWQRLKNEYDSVTFQYFNIKKADCPYINT